MRFFDPEEVHRLLPYDRLIESLAAAHREAEPSVGRSLLAPPPGEGLAGEGFLVLPAWAPGRALGVKMATIFPRNAERQDDLPTVQATYQLFDGADGRPVAVIDGTALTLRKTAADSGLGASFLVRADAETLAMIGAGALAPHLIAAHRAIRPTIRRVLVWNRSAPRRDRLVEKLRAEGIDAAIAEALDPAVREADIVCAATMATEPLVRGEWLKPGAHVDLVGGYTPEMRESDDEAVRRATLFVDYRGSTVGEVGDLTQPMAAGAIAPDAVQADLFDLCQGRHAGRRDDREITLYKNGGGGHLDLFTAECLVGQTKGPL